MYCQYCGKEIHDGAQVCMSCGCAVPNTNNAPGGQQQADVQSNAPCAPQQPALTADGKEISPKRGIVALILVFLVGSLGVHRFYVGKIWSGILMLLLFVVGYTLFLMSYMSTILEAVKHGEYYDSSNIFSTSDIANIGIGSVLLLGYSIWWIIDLIMICTSKFKDSKGLIIKL